MLVGRNPVLGMGEWGYCGLLVDLAVDINRNGARLRMVDRAICAERMQKRENILVKGI